MNLTDGDNVDADEMLRRKLMLDERELQIKAREKELERHTRLFEMKWKMLEKEILTLAEDKEVFRSEKERYYSNKRSVGFERSYDDVGMFFLGVHDELALKKRYRDLMKLFHPDCLNGDAEVMKSINTEYEKIRKKFYLI